MRCGKLAPRAEFQCRRCGKQQRMLPRTMVLVLTGCLIAGMFAVASASAFSSPPHPPEVAPAWPKMAAAPTVAKAANEVTAAELWAAYARNTVDADRRFRDRSVIVTGIVQSIDRDFQGSMIARLSTGDAFNTVHAKLVTRNDPRMAGVIKGRPVSLVCVGRGALLRAPQLGGCFVH